MSARISGVKNFVSMGDSFVRALPFNQVKSANANGSVAGVFAAPLFPLSVACGPSTATRSLERESECAGVAPETRLGLAAPTDAVAFAEAACAADASPAGSVVALPLDSRSETRFSSCSTRSSSHRSRSVNGAGASIFAAAAGLTGGSPLPSSANATTGTALPQNTAANMSDTSLFNLKIRILLSYLFLPSLNDPAILSYAMRSHH